MHPGYNSRHVGYEPDVVELVSVTEEKDLGVIMISNKPK